MDKFLSKYEFDIHIKSFARSLSNIDKFDLMPKNDTM